MAFSLEDIVQRFGGEVVGNGSQRVSSLAPLDQAGPDQLAFLANPKYDTFLSETKATAVETVVSDSQVPAALTSKGLTVAADATYAPDEFSPGETPYGQTIPDTQDRGLLFVNYQASISRTFESRIRRSSPSR